jgi:acyl carrier protein
MTELEQDIIAFIANETGTERSSVRLSSRLAQDIGLDGDDAVELFEEFGEKFHVDLTALGDHWHDHFHSEGLFGSSPGFMVVTITVQDLADAATSGKWVKRYHEPGEELFRTFR